MLEQRCQTELPLCVGRYNLPTEPYWWAKSLVTLGRTDMLRLTTNRRHSIKYACALTEKIDYKKDSVRHCVDWSLAHGGLSGMSSSCFLYHSTVRVRPARRDVDGCQPISL